MSEAILLRHNGQSVNKPGTSCLGCRRRKLKCSRGPEGCTNCAKSDLPCVYPTPEAGIKRKRGPYKKDKPPRQRHLEDLVKYLEPRNSSAELNEQSGGGSYSSPQLTIHPGNASLSGSHTFRPTLQTDNSEELVKDALIALTRSSANDHDTPTNRGAFLSHGQVAGRQDGSLSQHPRARHIFEYWQMFLIRVDPLTKVIHCPTFGKRLFDIVDNLADVAPSTEALLFSIYYSVVATCTARECWQKFGESQDVLLKRYGHIVEAALGNTYEIPALEIVQALVLYIIALRRKDDRNNVRTLFTLAVRSAQIIGLHEDPDGKYPPFEIEIRRRLWFHLYGLESKTAEESDTRTTSIMQNQAVQLPSNLNDCDIFPEMSIAPRAREGVTDVTFTLLRFEVHMLNHGLWSIRRRMSCSWQPQTTSRENQMNYFNQARARLQSTYLIHMDKSRPIDFMCMLLMEGMLLKAQLSIDFPFGTVPTRMMAKKERISLLQASVDIIRGTHLLATDERLSDWAWYFRGFMQWHSLGIVVAELNISNNRQFVESAWKMLDPILSDWDTIYKVKREEPAWEHVNSLIEGARYRRKQRLTAQDCSPGSVRDAGQHDLCTAMNSQTIMSMHEQPSPYSAYQSPMLLQSELLSQCAHTLSTTPQTNSALPPGDLPAETCAENGCMLNFNIEFAPFENLEDIDFSAFDHVFGGGSYDFLDPLGNLDLQNNEMTDMSGMMAQSDSER